MLPFHVFVGIVNRKNYFIPITLYKSILILPYYNQIKNSKFLLVHIVYPRSLDQFYIVSRLVYKMGQDFFDIIHYSIFFLNQGLIILFQETLSETEDPSNRIKG